MSETATVRMPLSVKKEIEEASRELGIPQSQVVSLSLKELKKKIFFQRVAEDFLRLRSDSEASKRYDKEFAESDTTLADGLKG
jgi:hypothetical protein